MNIKPRNIGIPRHVRSMMDLPRWSILRLVKPQSVSEHSHQVAALVIYLCQQIEQHICPVPSSIQLEALKLATIHDFPEMFTGDMPSPIKMEQLSIVDKERLRKWESALMQEQFGLDIRFMVSHRVTQDTIGDLRPVEDWEKEFSLPAYHLLKLADLLEAILKLKTEIDLGNFGARDAYNGLIGIYLGQTEIVAHGPLIPKSEDSEAAQTLFRQFLYQSIMNEESQHDGISIPEMTALGRRFFQVDRFNPL